MAGAAAVEDEVTAAAELVVDLDRVALRFAASLDVVPALEPAEAVVQLEAVADERRLEVVADVEVAVALISEIDGKAG